MDQSLTDNGQLSPHIKAEVQRILDSEAQRLAAQRARVSDAIYDALCGQLEAKHGGKWVAIPIEPTDKTETK